MAKGAAVSTVRPMSAEEVAVYPRVGVVVLNWRRAKDTIECVRSLQAMSYPRFDIVIVDNASADGSTGMLRAAFPGITVIENSENLGYAGGNNVGIRYALERGADYVLLLNNDTVVAPNLLRDLVVAAESDRRIGIVGPEICDYHDPTTIWFTGAMIDWWTGASPHIGLGERDHGQYHQRVEVDRLTGCAMMVRRDVFERVGVFDPEYFLYYEDVDFCVRAAKAGYKSYCVQTAKVWHKVSSSTRANEKSALHAYYQTRNRLLFLSKNSRIAVSLHGMNCLLFGYYLMRAMWPPFRRSSRARYAGRAAGLIDFYRGRFGIKAAYHRAHESRPPSMLVR